MIILNKMVENGIEETKNNKTTTSYTTTTNNNYNNDLFELPTNCFPLTHQVAGHFFGKGKTKLGKN
jgi:hypothetical protein